MRNILILLLILNFHLDVCSQNFKVCDFETKKGIPFSTVKFNKSGIYSDENGTINMSFEKNTILFFSAMNYINLEINSDNLKDTIFLTPKKIILEEVIVSNKPKKNLLIDFLKKAKNFSSWPLQSKSELVVFIKPKVKNKTFNLDSFSILLDKIKEFDKKIKNAKSVVRINVYELQDNKISNQLFSSKPIYVDAFEKETIEYGFDENEIYIDENGICIGIEMIGLVDENGKIIDNSNYIRPILTDKEIPDFTSMSYLKYTFSNNTKLESISEVITRTSKMNVNNNLNIKINLRY
jgi:hypothetical protein